MGLEAQEGTGKLTYHHLPPHVGVWLRQHVCNLSVVERTGGRMDSRYEFTEHEGLQTRALDKCSDVSKSFARVHRSLHPH
jgi:hypothetical protein